MLLLIVAAVASSSAAILLSLWLYSNHTAQMARLSDDKDLCLMKEITRRELIHVLESLSGPKDLVVDASLTRPLDSVANMKLLQDHGVIKVQQLAQRGPSNVVWSEAARARVYIVRATVENATQIARAVKANTDRQFLACFVDRRTKTVESLLEREGVWGVVQLHDLCLSLIHLDDDLFSLEMPHGDVLYSSARALWQLQSLYGQIPTVYGIGRLSQRTWNLMTRLYVELGEPRPSPDQHISHLFLFDRHLDPFTPLLTALTYESMLNDYFHVSCGKVNFEEVGARMPKAGEGSNKTTSSLKAVPLNDSDALFSNVRNRHMSAAASYLSTRVKELEARFERGSQQLGDLNGLKNFVTQDLKLLLEEHRSVELHLSACEVLLEKSAKEELTRRIELEAKLLTGAVSSDDVLTFLLDEILRGARPWPIIQIACLASVALDGLPQKALSTFRTHFVHAFGYEFLVPLSTLQSEGLLKEKAPSLLQSGPVPPLPIVSPPSFPSLQSLIRRLSLQPADGSTVDVRNPTSMSYVFTGVFTPPFCQVVSDTLKLGWETAQQTRTWGRDVFTVENSLQPAARRADTRLPRAVLVFFCGGVTLAEVAALRVLAHTLNFRLYVEPVLHVKKESKLFESLKKNVPVLNRKYRPTWWCPFGFAQTAVRQIFRSTPSLPWRREIIRFEDGGQLGTDWLEPDSCSTHDCAYILHAAMEAAAKGWRSVVVNPRGLGGVELLTPRTYNAAVTSDFQHVVAIVNKRYPNARKLGCGFSMGGMILWNYLSKCKKETAGIDAALVISSPWDPMDATFTIEEPFPRFFFNSFLANNLRSIVKPYKKLFEDVVDWEAVMNVKTVRDFDRAFVVPCFGYKDWPEYYHDAALYYKVHQIPVPTLCLNAADDCFSPLKSIPFEEVARSENVAVAVTRHGGHTAFMEDADPSAPGLIEKLFVEFSTMVFHHWD